MLKSTIVPIVLFSTGICFADTTQPADDAFKLSVTPYTNYAAPADLGDASGTVNVFRAGATVDAGMKFNDAFSGKLAIQGEYSHYGFHNLSAVPDGSKDVIDGELFSLRPSVNYYVNDHFGVYGGVLLNASGDTGARWSDAFTYGAFVGFNYKVADHVWIGTGIGFTTELEDNSFVLPLFTATWDFADNWSLTADGLSARVTYKFDDTFSAFVDGRYVFRQYRLASGDVIPNGALVDKSVPITVGLDYHPTDALTISGSVGAVVYRRVEFWSAGGNEVGADEADPALFAGLQLSYAF